MLVRVSRCGPSSRPLQQCLHTEPHQPALRTPSRALRQVECIQVMAPVYYNINQPLRLRDDCSSLTRDLIGFAAGPAATPPAGRDRASSRAAAGAICHPCVTYKPHTRQKTSHTCFDKCVEKPGSSLDNSEKVAACVCLHLLHDHQACVAKCFDRYIEATAFVSKVFATRMTREANNAH